MTTTASGVPTDDRSTSTTPTGPGRGGRTLQRLLPLSGPAFVVLVLTGNGLTERTTESTAVSGADPARDALATFAAKAGDPVVATGTALELVGFVLLAVFTAWLIDALRQRAALALAGVLALVGAVLMLAVKLGSASPYLVGILHHDAISPESALLLQGINDAGFVLGWLPWALFVAAAAVALRRAGLLGRFGFGFGLLVGGLGVVAAVLGVVAPPAANPLPFLAGLLWTLLVGVRVAVREWGTITGG
jgi:uncharacterized membrane protein